MAALAVTIEVDDRLSGTLDAVRASLGQIEAQNLIARYERAIADDAPHLDERLASNACQEAAVLSEYLANERDEVKRAVLTRLFARALSTLEAI